jgi:hypothetical protein
MRRTHRFNNPYIGAFRASASFVSLEMTVAYGSVLGIFRLFRTPLMNALRIAIAHLLAPFALVGGGNTEAESAEIRFVPVAEHAPAPYGTDPVQDITAETPELTERRFRLRAEWLYAAPNASASSLQVRDGAFALLPIWEAEVTVQVTRVDHLQARRGGFHVYVTTEAGQQGFLWLPSLSDLITYLAPMPVESEEDMIGGTPSRASRYPDLGLLGY